MSNWNQMDQWEMVLPPSRPTVEELKRIEEYLSPLDRMEPIAILGSTPEFRDLLFRMGFKRRFIFDKSIDFYQRMSKMLPCKYTEGEHLVTGEWLIALLEYPNCFRTILSDLTMGNISYVDRFAFYKAISNAIIPGGAFIDKVLAFDFPVPTLEELFEKYETLPINLRTINNFSSEVLFCSELVTKNNIVDSTKFYNIIDEGGYSDKIKYFSDAAHMITPEGFIWYYGIPWKDLKDGYHSFYRQYYSYLNNDMNSPYYNRTKHFFSIK